jgi:HAE1 family hydrophobic/amphiphilic exporter-1
MNEMNDNKQDQQKASGFSAIAVFSLKRPITIVMIFLSLVVVGLISSRLLLLEKWPEIKFAYVNVNVAYPSSTPYEVEQSITRPLEEAFATIGDIEAINSQSTTDGANIGIQFKSDVDVNEKTMLVKEQVDLVKSLLPDDVRRIVVQKAEMGNDAIMQIRITGDLDLENAYDLLNRYLVRPVERVSGVARVDFQGIEPRELQIIIDNDALKKYGIGFAELTQKLRDVNFTIASGTFKTGSDKNAQQIRIVPKGQIVDIEKIKNVVVNQLGIRLSDVATVQVVNGHRNYARHLDRKYSVGLEIFKESTANMVDVAERVLERIEEISKTPQLKGIKLVFLENSALNVKTSLRDVISAGVIGAFLSLLVLYFFTRDLATTLLVSLSIPISIVITLGALYFFGFTLNVLSLMGLMLAIGMLVDNSVVISESILTKRNNPDYSIVDAIQEGVSDVMVPVIAGTVTSVCIFLPIIFGSGDMLITFLSHVAVSIIAAMIISLFLAITVVPLIISKLKPKPIVHKKDWFDYVKNKYLSALKFTLNHRWFTALFISIVLGLGMFSYVSTDDDEGFSQSVGRDFWLPYHVDGSYSLERIKKDVDKIENYLYEHQEEFEIKSVYTYYQDNGFVISKIYLVDEEDAQKPIGEIKKAIMKDLPKIAIGKPSFRWRRGGGGNNNTMSLYLQGDSQQVLKELLPSVLLDINQIDGVILASVENKNKRQELKIVVNRERAIRLGLDPLFVAQNVGVAMRGTNLKEIVTPNGELPVVLRFYKEGEFKVEQLIDLPIKTQSGFQVSLASVADIVHSSSQQRINRHNRMGAIKIDIELEEDSNKKDIKETITTLMDRTNFPSGYNWTFEGQSRGMNMKMETLVDVLKIGVVLIFIVMAALFESLVFPFIVITSILFSWVGVFAFFAITGTKFDIMAGIGMLILMGVVVNNGIVLIDHINQLRLKGMMRREAIIQAGKDRLRPILMTVATTVVGLIPLAVSASSIGGDSNMPGYFPMARAIIGGLTFSTFISLLVLPSLYCWFDDLRHWMSDRFKIKTIKDKLVKIT